MSSTPAGTVVITEFVLPGPEKIGALSAIMVTVLIRFGGCRDAGGLVETGGGVTAVDGVVLVDVGACL